MIHGAGGNLLWRVEVRCSQQWGEAYARMNASGALEDLLGKPFEAEAWLDAIRIVNYLRRGVPLPKRLSEREVS
jgi:hypothetical protein